MNSTQKRKSVKVMDRESGGVKEGLSRMSGPPSQRDQPDRGGWRGMEEEGGVNEELCEVCWW